MNSEEILKMLQAVEAGKVAAPDAVERLKHLPFEDLGFAKVDHHRSLRQGFAEVVFAKGKTPQQIADIVRAMLEKKGTQHNVLVTRADRKAFAAVKRAAGKTARATKYYPQSGVITIERSTEIVGKGTILVVSAGTSDIPVAEEALLTARIMGNRAEHLYDGGLVAAPVIAVPTSVGYGASFGGVAALLGMLNSCASNVCVVNIDNGFGAARVASAINQV